MVNNPSAASEASESLIIPHFSLRIFAGVLVMLLAAVALVVLNVLALVLIEGILVLHLFFIVVFFFLSGWWGWVLGNIIMTRFSDQPVFVITQEGIQDHSLVPAAGTRSSGSNWIPILGSRYLPSRLRLSSPISPDSSH